MHLLLLLSYFVSFVQARPADAFLVFRGGTLNAGVGWEDGPNLGAESRLRVKWTDQEGRAVEPPAPFRLSIFHPELGYGSAPTSLQKLSRTGEYQVSEIYFTDEGEWDVFLALSVSENEKEIRVWKVRVKDRTASVSAPVPWASPSP